jgi:hypothetical protein
MPEFNLTEEQVGVLAADGSIVSHPSQDIYGHRYDKVNATRKYLTHAGKRYFVVLPTNADSEENTYKFPAMKPSAKE